MATPIISIIIPVYNECDNLAPLVDAIEEALLTESRPFELILVDDGSRDCSRAEMRRLAFEYAWVYALFLSRNYGQSTALQAGFDHARGDYIITLDADLQNDPADILSMLAILDEQADVDCVSGWRVDRQDAALSRRLPSGLANWLISQVTKVRLRDYGCALKAYRANIIRELHLYGEQHRFIPALAADVGAKIVEVPVNHRARVHGQSKYGIGRTLRVLLDLLWIQFTMRFLHRPMHAFGGVAASMVLPGLAILSWLTVEKLVFGADIGTRPLLLLGTMLTLLGGQFLAAGVLGELLIRIWHEPSGRKQYVLRQDDVTNAAQPRPDAMQVQAAPKAPANVQA